MNMGKQSTRLRLKRIFVIALCIIFAAQLYNTLGYERNVVYGLIDGKLNFSVSNGEATIIGYNGTESNLVIPSFVSDGTNSYAVTKIGNSALAIDDNLVRVTVPEGVTEIGDYAFYECNKLSEVILPSTLKTLGNYCFFRSELLQYFNLPDGLVTIGEFCFESKDLIESIRIPDSVISIGRAAFSGCSNLSSVTLSANLDSLAGFSNCESLTNIDIPESVTRIEDGCFGDSGNLANIVLPGGLVYLGDYSFLNCTSLTAIEIPQTVESIGQACFAGCDGLTEIVIPDSVTSLGDESLSDCDNLARVTLSNQLPRLGNELFEGCSRLQTVAIPESVLTIGDYCFSYCSSLMNPDIPDSVTKIGSYAYSHCGSITEMTIPDSVTQIGIGCFSSSSGITDVTLSKNLTRISNSCFSGCRSLKKINIPYGVTIIGQSSFSACDALKVVVIPASVDTIESGAFGIINLESVYFLGDAPTLGSNALTNGASLKAFYLTGRNGYTDPWFGYHTYPFSIAMHFESLGGSAVETLTPEYNSLIVEPLEPVRVGYDFLGWYNEPTCLNPWDFIHTKMPAGEVTLYAKWTPHNYKVLFNGNGAETGYMNSIDAKYDASTPLPSNQFIKTGFTFSGWATVPEGPAIYMDQTEAMNLTADANAQVELYAIWKTNTYNIKFDLNGGTSGVMADMAVPYDTTKALTANALKKDGYVFLGWATSSTGPVVYANQASVKNLTSTNGANVVLYAKWAAPITSATSYNYNSIKISWAAAGNATSYRIYRATSATGSYSLVKIADSTARSYVNTGLVTGKTYYYKVSVVSGGKTYHHSAYKFAKAIPVTPTIALSKYSSTSIKVSWSGVTGATKYQIFRATSATGTYTYLYTASSTARSWVNTGLTRGKTYYYKVRAYHLEGTTKVYGATSAVKYLKL